MEKTLISHSIEETRDFARQRAREWLGLPIGKRAIVVALKGNLGSGKTLFVQSVADALGIREKILSPTFVIHKSYMFSDLEHCARTLHHIDCYRLEQEEDIPGFAWKEILADPRAIILIEWPERIKDVLPKDTIWLEFEVISETARKIHRSEH
ncbi:MAG: tRNA (adenosine(37)-N6)-threonylcarbamoyltransferase complex ATPase subunit type 1 TsaE [Candidatus Wildermuthbacteria bacterium RIFCSPHIGHO2_12_FULL_45_9]|uniref:tRNA threonylcarbamoyladenosine biosynthesis protein TsaE n=1 Tax=Candidatus Wildermuthbacteria bacterium RIFCSPHIGHO2_02_FULL_45_25 TaxID=1802450 RepID=A0A1G2R1U5_9BACT|nr:MAG: tRNA (adenosine(37)-N6)-threonylcarbamoyltransferase complex ATPase subunit type 1 TsaE [Candidatus Wildermuthbacteria bacterium RIFCSPHIGHO2_01_FULL_45_20]OHA66359.1 MAG: tRNA (adenosine(37)-N6)-threonylcarbamoyltransferase complex ATPase subunit type 1 TsaE [Candidatus Wildermuthbacteria bacterium RIFCSPHIGHO2_02_FULL_45_25]OHA71999.1 MAG: tRNA (adenosine(37)-N6)-threonylcarbamoyltransferase complex ATPase subunit type 1 TsaE [Candidatus Wildermuthbacteria bacterium RIFCSPHIGHO2_12_FULL